MEILKVDEILPEIDINIRGSFIETIDEGGEVNIWAWTENYIVQPGINLQVKGPNNWKSDWYQEFRSLIIEAICTEGGEIKEIKAKITEKGTIGAKELVTTLSIYMSSKFGVYIGLMTQIVAMIVYAVVKLGIDAWCNINQQEKV